MIKLLTTVKLQAILAFLIFVAVITIIDSRYVLAVETIDTVDIPVDCTRAVNKLKCIEAKLNVLIGNLQNINSEIDLMKLELSRMGSKKESEQLLIAEQIQAISLSHRKELEILLSRFVDVSEKKTPNFENQVNLKIETLEHFFSNQQLDSERRMERLEIGLMELLSQTRIQEELSDRLALEFERFSSISEEDMRLFKSNIEDAHMKNEERMELLDQRFLAFEALLSKYADENQNYRMDVDRALGRISSVIEELPELKSRLDILEEHKN